MAMILDKNKFYQWDLERTLEIVDNIVTEVHFKKFTDNQLYVCEVYDNNGIRVVDIPNILFTTPEKFTAYFYCNDLFTKKHTSFDIIPRPKPTDYVYTETEVKRYDTLEQEIEELGNAINKLNQKIGEIPTIIVDQNYDAKSTNPQSGQAVAQALEEFTPVDENQLIGRKTEEGGVIIGDDDNNNKALAKNTFVNGNNNYAGYKGFKIIWIDQNVGYPYVIVEVDHCGDDKAYECYSVGDIVQIHLQSHYHDRYKINEISQGDLLDTYTILRLTPTYGEVVTDNLNLVSDENDPEGLRNWLYVLGKPYGEPMKYSKGATSFGNHNVVTGQGALGIGMENKVLGHGALAAGIGNKVGYAAFANGTENEAIHNRSAALGRGLKSGRVNQLLAGEFNEVEENAMFVIGGGTGGSPSTRKTLFKVEDNGDIYGKKDLKIEGDITYRDINLTDKITDIDYQLERPDRYKIVNDLPNPENITNYSDMYLLNRGYDVISKNKIYDKYIYNDMGNDKVVESSPIWDGTLVQPSKNNKGEYIIDSAEKLAYAIYNEGAIGEETNCYFIITKDIYLNDITKYDWMSNQVGSGLNSWYEGKSFNGTINGGYHTIYGLYYWYNWGVYTSNTGGHGLIPFITNGHTAIIKNLNIDCSTIKAKSNGGAFVGGNAGTVIMDSCSVGSNVNIVAYRAGALIGGASNQITTITNCMSYATTIVGEISGSNKDTELTSKSIGLITNYMIKKLRVSNCFNANGPICSDGREGNIIITDCYESIEGGLTEGITTISIENMQGFDVFDNTDKMPLLNKYHLFKATEGYPIYKFASFGWILIDDSVTKGYVDNLNAETKKYVDDSLKETILDSVDTIPDYIRYEINNNTVSITGILINAPDIVIIPETIKGLPVVSINDQACMYNDHIVSIIIPNSVINIGDAAFKTCINIEKVNLPMNLTKISNSIFKACSNIDNIIIPNKVQLIDNEAFSACTKLSNVTIPDTVMTIKNSAFANCINLTDVYYSGTEEQWNNIVIENNNTPILNATIHYNQTFATKDFVTQQIMNTPQYYTTLIDNTTGLNYKIFIKEGKLQMEVVE